MKSTTQALFVLIIATVPVFAGDDYFTTPASEPPSLESLIAPPSSSSLGKAVLESNYAKSRNLFLEATGGWVFATRGDLTSDVDKSLGKSAFGKGKTKSDAWLQGRSVEDIYDNGHTYGLRIGLNLDRTLTTSGKNPFVTSANHGRVYFRVSRTEFDGNYAHLGYIGDCSLDGQFHDYRDWGFAVGFERDFGEGRLRPFVGFEAGLKFVDDIKVDLIAEEGHNSHDFNNVNLYDDSVAIGLLFSFGIDFDVTQNFTLGVESGIGYQTGLDQDDSALSHFDLKELNDAEGNFWSIPVLISGRVSF